MFRYLRLILLFARVSFQNDAAYRLDFLLRIFTAAMHLAGELLALWVVFSNTKSLAGWSAPQVLILLGVFRVMVGLIGMLIAPNMRLIMEDIRGGTLDFVLTKPINSQFYVSFRQIVFWKLTDVILGVSLALFGSVRLGNEMPLSRLPAFLLMLAAGATIIYSFWLIMATSVFWFKRIQNIEMVFWNVFEAGRYPIDIYRPWVRWTLTFVVPLAFLTTTPAAALAGRATLPDLWPALLVAPMMLAAATLFWRHGLRNYSGASA